jgi:bifunctional DNase/RNase
MRSILLFVGIFSFTFLSYLTTSDSEENKHKTTERVQMDISGIGFDQMAQTPVVLLLDKQREKVLPIWIGLCEARAIEIGLSGEVTPRPFTYDLVAAIIRTMKAKIERVVIVDLRDQVFYAQVEVSVNGNTLKIDARPSDALALASRMNAPVFVTRSVLENAATIEPKVEKKGT